MIGLRLKVSIILFEVVSPFKVESISTFISLRDEFKESGGAEPVHLLIQPLPTP